VPSSDVTNGLTPKTLLNGFLTTKEERLQTGDLSRQTFHDHYQTCRRIIILFRRELLATELRPDDYRSNRAALAEWLGFVSLKNTINCVCSAFNHSSGPVTGHVLPVGRPMGGPPAPAAVVSN
jgi:hypothetical protein